MGFFDVVKGIGKVALPAAIGFATGGPLGAAVGGAKGVSGLGGGGGGEGDRGFLRGARDFFKNNPELLALAGGAASFFGDRKQRGSQEAFDQSRLDLLTNQLGIAEKNFASRAPLRAGGRAAVLDFLQTPNSISQFINRPTGTPLGTPPAPPPPPPKLTKDEAVAKQAKAATPKKKK